MSYIKFYCIGILIGNIVPFTELFMLIILWVIAVIARAERHTLTPTERAFFVVVGNIFKNYCASIFSEFLTRSCTNPFLLFGKYSYIYIYIYYRFIVRFPIGLDFLFITFTILLHLLLSWTSSLSISSSAISTSTLSTHVSLGLPTGLLPSTLHSIHFFTQSSSHVHTISVYHF